MNRSCEVELLGQLCKWKIGRYWVLTHACVLEERYAVYIIFIGIGLEANERTVKSEVHRVDLRRSSWHRTSLKENAILKCEADPSDLGFVGKQLNFSNELALGNVPDLFDDASISMDVEFECIAAISIACC